jgi:hypothetical protein
MVATLKQLVDKILDRLAVFGPNDEVLGVASNAIGHGGQS